MNGWWYVLIIVVAWTVARMFYNRGDGQHRVPDHEFGLWPTGTVWYAHDKWWTMPRRDFAQPRWFDRRSNPLDFEYEYETVQVPPKFQKIPHEVEY